MNVNEETCKLIEAVKAGDQNAFAQLYEEFYKLAYFFAYKLCHNEADAKDAVQDTFIEVHRSINTLKENAYFKAWLYKIVHSKCKKIFRKNKYITIDFEDEPLINSIEEERIEFTPEQMVHFTNDKEVLDSFIAQLPESQAIIITLFYLEQFSIKEIADILEIPIGTVKSRLSYGRTYLKKALDEYEKTQGVTLSFREFDALVTTVLLNQVNQLVKNPMVFKFFNRVSDMMHGTFAQLVIGTVSAAMVLGGIYTVGLSNIGGDNEDVITDNRFVEKQVGDEIIDNAQDAYFTLISWACCAEMINEKTEAEILFVKPLYDELKVHGGAYYQQLQKDQWTKAYESRLPE